MITIHFDYIDGTEVSYSVGLNSGTEFTTNCLDFFSQDTVTDVMVKKLDGSYILKSELLDITKVGEYYNEVVGIDTNILELLKNDNLLWKTPTVDIDTLNNLKYMAEKQDELNIITCGTNWRSGLTDDNKDITWLRYIRMELSELIDSSDLYKHWKDLSATVDWDNIDIEIVDVWHFLMSETMVKHNSTYIANLFSSIYMTKDISENIKDYNHTIDICDDLTEATFNRNDLRTIFNKFIDIMISVNMSIDKLYELYIIKNFLNTYRQDHGYAEGTYHKVINGKEDNVLAVELFSREDVNTVEELYDAFDIVYQAYLATL